LPIHKKTVGQPLEKSIPKNLSSSEIFELMTKAIVECNQRDFKRFHIDLSAFSVIGTFVDWKELTTKLNSFVYPELRQTYFDNKNK